MKKSIFYILLPFSLVVFIFYLLLDKIKVLFDTKTDALENSNLLDDSGSNILRTKAQSISNVLYACMCEYGTDEDGIKSVLNNLSNADFNHVYNCFGVRWYNIILGCESASLMGSKYDLIQWLKAELSNSDYDELKNKFSSLP